MDWITIYTTTNRLEVSYLQDLLEEDGIHSVAMDQTDSMYKFGENKTHGIFFRRPKSHSID